jgi:hypothetical protein
MIEKSMPTPKRMESRQFRAIAETSGRILRAQADRKKVFQLIQPILGAGIIKSKDKKPRKDRKAIAEAVQSLKATAAESGAQAVYMQNLVEQACNYFLEHEQFPETYEEMQTIPLLKRGLLTYAADEGGENGRMYRYKVENGQLRLRLKVPGPDGKLVWLDEMTINLPADLAAVLGEPRRYCAPTLREVEEADGGRYAVLDMIVEREARSDPSWETRGNLLAFDWGVRTLLTVVALDASGNQISRPFFLNTGGFDGKQARLRKNIDALKSARDELKERKLNYGGRKKRQALEHEIKLSWAKYERRNEALAHLCSNLLLLFAEGYGCHAIAGEWLGSLKSVGRGRYTKSRWRNWRNNTTIRSSITVKLKYKCKLRGVKLRLEYPRGTSHTCPRCGKESKTYPSPEHENDIDWGKWMKCEQCGWNGSRDYAGALNIGRLAVAFYQKLAAAQVAGEVSRKTYRGYKISELVHQPASYIGAGAALPIPPKETQKKPTFFCSRKSASLPRPSYYVSGWHRSVTIFPKCQPGDVAVSKFV